MIRTRMVLIPSIIQVILVISKGPIKEYKLLKLDSSNLFIFWCDMVLKVSKVVQLKDFFICFININILFSFTTNSRDFAFIIHTK